MLELFKKFEKAVVMALAALLAATILFSTLELAVTLFKDLASPPLLMLEMHELLDIFGLFLLVLLGLELLETMKAYLRENVVHVEVVMIVAIIAIARKVIILDIKELHGTVLLGLAALLAALAFGYVHIKRTHLNCGVHNDKSLK
ncbi:MAG TPA: phosphate-starvation-inducible PsiE family protein [Elusimicrobiales bacterium]|nr:phosphate-starvation-inducible PsiE family protein [Elusimicrobiales bacterium]